MGKLPAVPGPHLQAKCPWIGKNRSKIENQMCRITYPRWAALHQSPQKHSLATGTILIQGEVLWVHPGKFCVACASKMQEMGERGQSSGCFFTEPCSNFCTWPSPLRAHREQGNLYPQLSLMSFSLAEVTPADLPCCPSLPAQTSCPWVN